MGLREQGFRFVYQDGTFRWTHPAEIKEDSIDCTDMSDDEFIEFAKQIPEEDGR